MTFAELTSHGPVPSLPPLPERIRLRRLFGISQARLAASIGVTRQTINAWEGGHKEPTGARRVEYAATLSALARKEKESREGD